MRSLQEPRAQPHARHASTRPCRVPARQSRATRTQLRRPALSAVLDVGSKLSDFPDYSRELTASDGSTLKLSSLKGKNVVLFFYPAAATPGCTKQACKFRDDYARFQDQGALVYGISADEPSKNAEFAKDQRLPFPLLSDAGQALRKGFGIKGDLFGALPGRQTYIFDKQGVCRLSFNSQFQPEKHSDEALKVLASLK